MLRKIVDFDVDEIGDPVALLDCGHRRHVRHQPPWMDREWVTTATGRQAMIGKSLNCALCDENTEDHLPAASL